MVKHLAVLITGAVVMAASVHLHAAPQSSSPPVSSVVGVRAVLDRYCVSCHNQKLKTAGLALDSVDLSAVSASGSVLEKVVRKLRLGAMPPQGLPRPEPATYQGVASWLEGQLDHDASVRRNPGRTEALHRLNRAEYQNAIRDLLDLEGLDIALMLPTDDASYGFDNMAGVLGMSPTHLERYLAAARKISRVAVGDVTLPPDGETFNVRADLSQDDRLDDLPFGTRGGILVRRYFAVDGEYLIRFQTVSGLATAEKEPNRLEVTIDGQPVYVTQVFQKPVPASPSSDEQVNVDYEIRVPLRAGIRNLAVTFAQSTFGQAEDLLQPYLRPPAVSAFRLTRVGGYSGPYVSFVTFTGPFNTTGVGDTPARRRIFVCRPAGVADEPACARRILSTLARRAYRRPLADADLRVLLRFFEQGRSRSGFDSGIQLALERILASEEFLFRIEEDSANVQPGTAYRISDLELASRLSFFLWSSIPDDELLDAASRARLHEPAILARQVRRMLADPRAEAFARNFAGQWLRLRNVEGANPDTRLFPDFDANLRDGFRRETELFFGSILQENRSVLDLLDADYTFVNERLARHYGIPNVYGSRFRRVTIQDDHRRGLLGQGSILTVTSQANRTSPVVRGKWILENLLGAPPPPPPPNVPALEERTKGKAMTMKEAMTEHRRNPVCAACHKVMDPLGFALENFDAVGAWRSRDAGVPVDAGGGLPDGSTFEGVAGLRAALRGKPDVFVTTLTEKLLTYALGRGLEYYDEPAVRAIVRESASDEYRLTSLLMGIVRSLPFQFRQSAAATPAPSAITAAVRE